MDEAHVIAALVLAGVVGYLPDVYRLMNNHVLSKIFRFKKIEDVNFACGYMVQFTFILILALCFMSVVEG